MTEPTGPTGPGGEWRMRVRDQRVTVRDGLRIRVEERNPEAGGVPVLILHGFTGSIEAWGEPLLDALASTRRIFQALRPTCLPCCLHKIPTTGVDAGRGGPGGDQVSDSARTRVGRALSPISTRFERRWSTVESPGCAI